MCNHSADSARQTAQQYEVPRFSAQYQDLLNDDEVQAVIIATPPYLHAEMLEAALKAGKHVLLEKPLAASREDVARIQAAVAAHPDQVVLDASCRHARLQPKFVFVKSLIDQGELGEVYYIHHNHLLRGTFIEWNDQGTWAMDKQLAGGGPFVDWGVYDLAFHLGVLGDAPHLHSARSFSRAGLRDLGDRVAVNDIEQHGAAWLEFEQGLVYYYERGAGVHNESACETRIYGTRGGLRLYYPSWESNLIDFFYADEQPHTRTCTVDMSHAPDDNLALIQHFIDCVQGQAEPMMPVPLAAKHMEILFRILE